MKRILAAAIGFAVLIPASPAAHRLDEYLQASRVSLERDGIALELDLTPGANIASVIIPLLDRDADGGISPIEARAYGEAVLTDLVLELDGQPVTATLTRVEVPPIDEIRDGLGTVQLRAVGRVGTVAAGGHLLYYRNNHEPAGSVYLVNALVPEASDVGVVAQTRDRRQQAVRIDYTVGPRWPARLPGLVLGLAALSALLTLRKRAGSRVGSRAAAGVSRFHLTVK